MHFPTNKTNPFRQTGEIWLMEFRVPYKAVAQMEEGLEDLPFQISSFEDDPAYIERETEPETIWKISLYSEQKPDEAVLRHRIIVLAAICGIDIPDVQVTLLPPHDWVSEVQKSFSPIHMGRYFVHCSSYEGDIPPNTHRLQINASLAFGTGEHETTGGCLAMLSALAASRRFSHMLDMGCGTGILSVAMAKTWKHPVVAADIDSNAVRITRDNARLNHVAGYITAVQSNGYTARKIGEHAPYDLIVSNILADPLVKFAKDLRKNLQPGGMAILSGLLNQQENRVLAAHRMQGLRLAGKLRKNKWSVLVLKG